MAKCCVFAFVTDGLRRATSFMRDDMEQSMSVEVLLSKPWIGLCCMRNRFYKNGCVKVCVSVQCAQRKTEGAAQVCDLPQGRRSP